MKSKKFTDCNASGALYSENRGSLGLHCRPIRNSFGALWRIRMTAWLSGFQFIAFFGSFSREKFIISFTVLSFEQEI